MAITRRHLLQSGAFAAAAPALGITSGIPAVSTAHAQSATADLVWRHALLNARMPIVTLMGIQLGQLLGGVVITETVFSWPGIGKMTVDAIFARDYPLVQGAVLITATLFVLINLATDLFYTALDPRVRLS